jgi:hypothetical protein
MTTAEHFRTRRIAAGLSQEALARRAGVALVTVARVEGGRSEPSPLTVARLTAALDAAPTLVDRATDSPAA